MVWLGMYRWSGDGEEGSWEGMFGDDGSEDVFAIWDVATGVSTTGLVDRVEQRTVQMNRLD